jgi:hypothetical protein
MSAHWFAAARQHVAMMQPAQRAHRSVGDLLDVHVLGPGDARSRPYDRTRLRSRVRPPSASRYWRRHGRFRGYALRHTRDQPSARLPSCRDRVASRVSKGYRFWWARPHMGVGGEAGARPASSSAARRGLKREDDA